VKRDVEENGEKLVVFQETSSKALPRVLNSSELEPCDVLDCGKLGGRGAGLAKFPRDLPFQVIPQPRLGRLLLV
jgi:hypothetical protein